MTEIKNTIKIEVDGINKYLADVKAIEKEISQIEQGFRKAGLTERAAMVEAEKYRKKMHADIKVAERLELQRIKKVEREELQRIKRVEAAEKKSQRSVKVGRGGVSMGRGGGMKMGGAAGAAAGVAIAAVAVGVAAVSFIKSNKDLNKAMGDMAKNLDSIGSGFTNLIAGILEKFAKPLANLTKRLDSLSMAWFGVSLRGKEASAVLKESNKQFNAEMKVLKEGNISVTSRAALIKHLNETYSEYLPNLLTEFSTIEEITAAQDLANKMMENKYHIMAVGEKRQLLASKEVDLELRKISDRRFKEQEEAYVKSLSAFDKYIYEYGKRQVENNIIVSALGDIPVKELEADIEDLKKSINELDKLNNAASNFKAGLTKQQGADLLSLEYLKKMISLGYKLTAEQKIRYDALMSQQSKEHKGYKTTVDWLEKIKKANQDIFQVIQSSVSSTASDAKGYTDRGEFIKAQEKIDELKDQLKTAEEEEAKIKSGTSTIEDLERERLAKIAARRKAKEAKEFADAGAAQTYGYLKENNRGFKGSVEVSTFTKGMSEEAEAMFHEQFKEFITGNRIKWVTDSDAAINAWVIVQDKIKKGIISTNEEIAAEMKKQGVQDIYTAAADRALATAEHSLAKTEAELKKSKDITLNSGVETAGEIKKITDAIDEAEADLATKKEEVRKEGKKAELEAYSDYYEYMVDAGLADIEDAYVVKKKEIDIMLKEMQDKIDDANKALTGQAGREILSVNTTDPEKSSVKLNNDARKLGLDNTYITEINAIETMVNNLVITYNTAMKELEEIDTEFAEKSLAAFSAKFTKQSKLSEIELEHLNMDLKNSYDERAYFHNIYSKKAEKEGREFNDLEIIHLNQLTNDAVTIEGKRYALERYLRVGAFLKEIEDIKSRGGNVLELAEEFALKERKIAEENMEALKAIREENHVPMKTDGKKGELREFGLQDGMDMANGLNDLYQAFAQYQADISARLMQDIQDSIDATSEAAAEALSNISSMEEDLEGKRSGRREALLRGIELEKAREEALNDKRIQLQARLQAEEDKANERRKAHAIAQVLINMALAATNMWANITIPYPAAAGYGIAQSAIFTGLAALQIATIDAQQFADGGLLEGASHENGGIPFTIDGRSGFEAEGGEAIMSKRTVERYGPQLNQMQISTGSKALFADGGMLPDYGSMSSSMNGMNKEVIAMLNQPLYVNVTDISNVQGRKVRATSIANI